MEKNWKKSNNFIANKVDYKAVNMMGKNWKKVNNFMVRNTHYNAVNMIEKNKKIRHIPSRNFYGKCKNYIKSR